MDPVKSTLNVPGRAEARGRRETATSTRPRHEKPLVPGLPGLRTGWKS